MLSNTVLKAIQERRSVFRFKPDAVDQDKIDAIIEAGRWAPSFVNSQPWSIIVVKDKETKRKLRELAITITGIGIEESPVTLVVTVDTQKDPHHYVEDGAAATENMALAAHSLGLGAGWIGIWGTEAETSIQQLLKLPETVRAVSLLPIGIPDESPEGHRKPLEELTQFR